MLPSGFQGAWSYQSQVLSFRVALVSLVNYYSLLDEYQEIIMSFTVSIASTSKK